MNTKIIFISSPIGLLLFTSIFAQSNLSGTFDGKGIYQIEDMSVTEKDSSWKFIGYVKNIGNNTLYLNDIVIEMFNSKNNLIEFTTLGETTEIEPGDRLPFRLVANDINATDFDHYLVRVLHTNNSQDDAPTQSNSTYPTSNKELYDECVRVAGVEFCDFLFRK